MCLFMTNPPPLDIFQKINLRISLILTLSLLRLMKIPSSSNVSEYVKPSPPNSEPVSSKVTAIVIPEVEDEDDNSFNQRRYPIREKSGYHQKDRKPSQNDKTEHGMEKTVQNQGQSPKMPKSESILKNQQSNRSRN
ncbi:hypothetical protein Tco_0784455 [Tanacetum coccineum]